MLRLLPYAYLFLAVVTATPTEASVVDLDLVEAGEATPSPEAGEATPSQTATFLGLPHLQTPILKMLETRPSLDSLGKTCHQLDEVVRAEMAVRRKLQNVLEQCLALLSYPRDSQQGQADYVQRRADTETALRQLDWSEDRRSFVGKRTTSNRWTFHFERNERPTLATLHRVAKQIDADLHQLEQNKNEVPQFMDAQKRHLKRTTSRIPGEMDFEVEGITVDLGLYPDLMGVNGVPEFDGVVRSPWTFDFYSPLSGQCGAGLPLWSAAITLPFTE